MIRAGSGDQQGGRHRSHEDDERNESRSGEFGEAQLGDVHDGTPGSQSVLAADVVSLSLPYSHPAGLSTGCARPRAPYFEPMKDG